MLDFIKTNIIFLVLFVNFIRHIFILSLYSNVSAKEHRYNSGVSPVCVVVNGRFIWRGLTGVERYANQLVHELSLLQQRTTPPQADLPPMRLVSPGSPTSGWRGHLWEQAVLPGKVLPGELLWSPANTGPLAVSNQALTLHDASVLDHPEWFSPLFATWYGGLLPRLTRRVRRVFTDSQFSRQRILERLNLPEEKVIAIPAGVDLAQFHPVSPDELQRVRLRYNLKQAYMLVVGTIQPRKNLPRLLSAWQQVADRLEPIELVIAGGTSSVFRQARFEPGQKRVRWLGNIAEADLSGLYSGAEAYLLPSLYEGFGLTALEAMACGAPICVSQAGALPEVVGEAGIYLDPLSVDSIAQALLQIMEDETRRNQLIQKGLQRASQFSWKQTACLTWEALQGAVQ